MENSIDSDEHVLKVQQLFVQHSHAIKGFILSLVPGFNEAEDILQEVFLTVTQKAESFQLGSNFKAWSFAIARFKVLEAIRKRSANEQPLSPEVVEALCSAAPMPVEQDGRLELLKDCLNKLGPKARQIIELRYREGLKSAAIATQLGLQADSVYVSLSRSRVALKNCVKRKMGGPST